MLATIGGLDLLIWFAVIAAVLLACFYIPAWACDLYFKEKEEDE